MVFGLSLEKNGSTEYLDTHHKAVHMGQTFKCPECDVMFTQRGHLASHHKSVHMGHKFQCPVCDIQFSQKGNLDTHHKAVQMPRV
jgi:uncharacterized C2H2 Zn-finger protein